MDKQIYQDGIRFECTGCGECCKSRGRFQYVYASRAERERLAKHFGLSLSAFTQQYCQETSGYFHFKNPKGDCQFLDGLRCTVYEARPEQCRTWPFWPDNMETRVWEKEVKPGCEGIGRGRLYPREEIEVFFTAEKKRYYKK